MPVWDGTLSRKNEAIACGLCILGETYTPLGAAERFRHKGRSFARMQQIQKRFYRGMIRFLSVRRVGFRRFFGRMAAGMSLVHERGMHSGDPISRNAVGLE